MADLLQDADGSDMHNMSSVIESFQKKNNVVGSVGSATINTAVTSTAAAAGNQMVRCIILSMCLRVCEYIYVC